MVAIEYLSTLYFFAGGGPQMDGCPTVLLDFEMRFLETIFGCTVSVVVYFLLDLSDSWYRFSRNN